MLAVSLQCCTVAVTPATTAGDSHLRTAVSADSSFRAHSECGRLARQRSYRAKFTAGPYDRRVILRNNT